MSLEIDFNIEKLLQSMNAFTPVENGISVTTHCLYPSNTAVNVYIRKQLDGYVVFDNRGAIEEVDSSSSKFSNLEIADIDKKIKAVVNSQGLSVNNGIISSPKISLEAIPTAIILVANASKEVAYWMLNNLKFKLPRNFKKDVTNLLFKYFNQNLKHDQMVVGQSNKSHKFGHLIYLTKQRKLLVDAVLNEATSINAKLVANIDIKQLDDPNIIQYMIYDDQQAWKSSDLKLIEMGAKILPFSKAEREIKNLAA